MFHTTIKRFITSLTVLLAVAAGGVFATPALAADPFSASKQAACQGVQFNASGDCGSIGGEARIKKALRMAVSVLSFIAGFAAVIMIIIAGFRYITSGGEPAKVSGSKDALLYAIIGLIVVAMAQFIVRYVLASSK